MVPAFLGNAPPLVKDRSKLLVVTVTESGEEAALDYVKRRLKPDGSIVVVDVGANVGQFALMAANRLQPTKIYSFEPSSQAFQMLQEEIRDADLLSVISPQPCALSDREGEVVLYSSHHGATIASLYNLRNPPVAFKPEFNQTVVTKTLDRFCYEHGIQEIKYLKIDVEGHELSVLLGAQRMLSEKRIQFVQFEFGEANIDSRTYFRDFFELLGPDFNFYRIVSDGLRKIDKYHANLEVFATINYLAERKF